MTYSFVKTCWEKHFLLNESYTACTQYPSFSTKHIKLPTRNRVYNGNGN